MVAGITCGSHQHPRGALGRAASQEMFNPDIEFLCVGDDLKTKMGIAFPRLARVKTGETVCFSWIVYKSRAHRDRVNAKVMKDPRMAKMMNELMPFDVKRMAYGGFKVLVDA